MAEIERPCQQCGRTIVWGIGESVAGGELYWNAAYRCEHCGEMLEMDGRGELPGAYREAVLRQDGEWGLEVLSGAPDVKVAAAQTLRETLGISLTEVKDYLRRMPGVIRTGTRAEMEYLSARLKRRRVPVALKPLVMKGRTT